MSSKSNDILQEIAVEIIDKTSEGFLLNYNRNEAVYANPALKRMHGFDPKETITQEKTLETLFPDSGEPQENMLVCQKYIALENPPPLDFQITTKEGKQQWYMFTLSHIANGYRLVNVHNITD